MEAPRRSPWAPLGLLLLATFSGAAQAATWAKLPPALLERELLMTSMVMEVDRPDALYRMVEPTILVQLIRQGDRLRILRRPTSARPEPALVREFPLQEVDGALEVDLDAPVELELFDGTYRCPAPRTTGDVLTKEDCLSFAQTLDFLPHDCPPDRQGFRSTHRFQLLARENPGYEPRAYPPGARIRFGFFTASPEAGPQDPLTRWDLRSPIVIRIHPGWPAELVPVVQDISDAWNDTFERVAGRRPFLLREESDTTLNFPRPGEISLHYLPDRSAPVFYPQAHSLVDPRSGEIFAGILPVSIPHVDRNIRFWDFGRRLRGLDGRGGQPATEVTPEMRAIYLRSMISHELGHYMGLTHNFRSSRDVDHFLPGEVTASLMEYLPHGYLTPMAPQPYDEAALSYAYGAGSVPGTDPLFGGPGDRYTDPDTNDGDLGEPLAFARAEWKLLVEKRTALSELRSDGGLETHLRPVLGAVVKLAGRPGDPRESEARHFLRSLLEDAGPPIAGGGLEGRTQGEVPGAIADAKRRSERLAVLLALQETGPRVFPGSTPHDLVEILARTVLDEGHHDLFEVRIEALRTMRALGAVEPLETIRDRLRQALEDDPGALTAAQDRLIVRGIENQLGT